MSSRKSLEEQPLIERDVDSSSSKPKKIREWQLNDAVEKIGNGRFQMWILLLAGMGQLTDGIQQLSVGFLLHHLGKVFNLTNHGKAMIGTVSGIGMLIGSITWGRLSDSQGRRFSFIGTMLMSGIFGILSAFPPSYGAFLVFRCLLSMGVGGNVPLGFTVFCEVSAKDKRGAYLTMLEAFWSLGAVLSCALAWFMLTTAGSDWYIVACSAPGIFLAIAAYFYMPESPRFLLVCGDVEGAQNNMDKIALANGKNKYVGWKLTDKKMDVMNAPSSSFCSSLFELFTPQYIWKTLPLFAIYFALAFGCGVFVWMPVLLEEKRLEVMSMYRSMVIMALSQIPGVLVSAYLVEVIGRKFAIGSFFFFGAVSMVIFAVSSRESLVVITSVFMEFFLAGVNGSLSAYTVEVFPTSMRSTAMGACSALSRLSSVANPTIWATLLNIGVDAAIYAGALSLLIGLALLWLLPVETNQDRVVQDFSEKDKKSS